MLVGGGQITNPKFSNSQIEQVFGGMEKGD
jgi:hypothetical protein